MYCICIIFLAILLDYRNLSLPHSNKTTNFIYNVWKAVSFYSYFEAYKEQVFKEVSKSLMTVFFSLYLFLSNDFSVYLHPWMSKWSVLVISSYHLNLQLIYFLIKQIIGYSQLKVIYLANWLSIYFSISLQIGIIVQMPNLVRVMQLNCLSYSVTCRQLASELIENLRENEHSG